MDTAVIDKAINNRRLEDRLEDIEVIVKRIQNAMEVSGTESTKVFAEVREKFRLMGQQIAHLNSITFPAYWEQEIKELKDAIYKADCKITEEVARWKEFREKNYFQAVTEIEALQFVKQSGITLKELSDAIGLEMSGISRLLNGERKNDNPVVCHKIKQYCLERMSQHK